MKSCWVCSQAAVWKVTAEKPGRPKTEDNEGTPDVFVEFYACEKCIPFTIAGPEKAKGAAS